MAQRELDSFYVKFKNLLREEKDATLTLKSEAGRAFVTLSLDLGHVFSGQDLFPRSGGPRNGPARIRRREKRAAARAELATEETSDNVESTATVEETETFNKPAAEEATVKVKSTDNVADEEKVEEPNDAEQAEDQEIEETAEKAKENNEEVTAAKVEDVADEFCTDDVYHFKPKETKFAGTQTLESEPLPNSKSKPSFDYYSLRYDDLSD